MARSKLSSTRLFVVYISAFDAGTTLQAEGFLEHLAKKSNFVEAYYFPKEPTPVESAPKREIETPNWRRQSVKEELETHEKIRCGIVALTGAVVVPTAVSEDQVDLELQKHNRAFKFITDADERVFKREVLGAKGWARAKLASLQFSEFGLVREKSNSRYVENVAQRPLSLELYLCLSGTRGMSLQMWLPLEGRELAIEQVRKLSGVNNVGGRVLGLPGVIRKTTALTEKVQASSKRGEIVQLRQILDRYRIYLQNEAERFTLEHDVHWVDRIRQIFGKNEKKLDQFFESIDCAALFLAELSFSHNDLGDASVQNEVASLVLNRPSDGYERLQELVPWSYTYRRDSIEYAALGRYTNLIWTNPSEDEIRRRAAQNVLWFEYLNIFKLNLFVHHWIVNPDKLDKSTREEMLSLKKRIMKDLLQYNDPTITGSGEIAERLEAGKKFLGLSELSEVVADKLTSINSMIIEKEETRLALVQTLLAIVFAAVGIGAITSTIAAGAAVAWNRNVAWTLVTALTAGWVTYNAIQWLLRKDR